MRSRELLGAALDEAQPEIVFHLAAQPLVLAGLADPVGTFQSNVLGVVNLLEAVRRLPSVRAWSWSPATNATCGRNAAVPKAIRWAGTTPTAPARPAPRSSPRPTATAISRRGRRRRRHGAGRQRDRRRRLLAPGRLLPDLVRAFAAGEPAELRHPGGRPALAACARRAGRLPAAGRAPDRQSRLASRPPGTSAPSEDGTGPRRGSPSSRPQRFGGGTWRAAASDLADRGAEPAALLRAGAALAGLAAATDHEQAVSWAVDGYRALLRDHDTGWLIDRSTQFEALQPTAERRGSGPATAGRARACLCLSRPTSRSSSSAAARAPGWARSRRSAPSPCWTSARSRCSCTSWRWYGRFGFRRFVLCTGHRSEVISGYFANFASLNSDFTVDLARADDQLPPARSGCRSGR